jgi:hypothetical protein
MAALEKRSRRWPCRNAAAVAPDRGLTPGRSPAISSRAAKPVQEARGALPPCRGTGHQGRRLLCRLSRLSPGDFAVAHTSPYSDPQHRSEPLAEAMDLGERAWERAATAGEAARDSVKEHSGKSDVRASPRASRGCCRACRSCQTSCRGAGGTNPPRRILRGALARPRSEFASHRMGRTSMDPSSGPNLSACSRFLSARVTGPVAAGAGANR